MAINFGRGQGDMFAMLMKALQANKVEPNKPRDRNVFNVKRAIQGDSFLPTKEAIPVEETVEEPTGNIAKTFLSGFIPEAPTTMPPGQEAANFMNNRNQALIDLLPSKEQIGTGIETAKDMAGKGMDMLKQGTSDYLDYASNQKSGGTILDTLRGFGRDASDYLDTAGIKLGDFLYDKLGGNLKEQAIDNQGALMNDLIEAGGDPLEVLSLVKGVDPSRNIMNDVPVDEFGLEFGGDYSDEDILNAVYNFNLSTGESPMPLDELPGSSLDIGAEADQLMGGGGSPLLDAMDMVNLPTYGQDFSGESFEEFGPPLPPDVSSGVLGDLAMPDPGEMGSSPYSAKDNMTASKYFPDANRPFGVSPKDMNWDMLLELSPEKANNQLDRMTDYIHNKESSGGKASKASLDAAFKREGAQGEYQQRPIFIEEVTKNMGFNNGQPYDPNDPVMARAATRHYLKTLMSRGMSEKEALASYNAGPTGMRKGLGSDYAKGYKV